MKKQALAAATAAALVSLTLAACTSTAKTTEATGMTTASEPVTLSVTAWKGQGTNEADMPKLNAAFEAANPNITLDFQYVDNASYVESLNPRLAGGNAADVIMVDREKMINWASQGYLADLSDQPWVERQDPSFGSAATLDGKVYQVVSESIGFGLYVNLDMLKSVGVDAARAVDAAARQAAAHRLQ